MHLGMCFCVHAWVCSLLFRMQMAGAHLHGCSPSSATSSAMWPKGNFLTFSVCLHFLTYKMGHSKIIPVRIKCQHLQSIWHPVWMAHSKCLAVQFYFYRVVYGSILYLSNLPCLYVLSLSPGKWKKELMRMTANPLPIWVALVPKSQPRWTTVAMVNSKPSSAHEAFVPRVLSVHDLFASSMKWYTLQTLAWRVTVWEIWTVFSVPPEPRLFFAVSMSDLGPLVKYACLIFRKSFYAHIKAIKEIHWHN